MNNKKYNYPLSIKKIIVNLYGEDSNIYRDMMNGDQISYLIKKSYKEKSKIRNIKIKNLKELYAKCKKFEDACNVEENISI